MSLLHDLSAQLLLALLSCQCLSTGLLCLLRVHTRVQTAWLEGLNRYGIECVRGHVVRFNKAIVGEEESRHRFLLHRVNLLVEAKVAVAVAKIHEWH